LRLGAVGERRQEVGQLGAPMFGHEPFHALPPAPARTVHGRSRALVRERRMVRKAPTPLI
jgi:hypothetical protein